MAVKMGRESLCGKRGRAVSFLPAELGRKETPFYFAEAM